ncbi:hypothetical protein HD806DRAFT_535447 [Xylariaceae sp. AK1471]|nr:hypothetical protein HD806DRAFT_535447 [Xylariaceae sp. AK1471]
MDSSKVPNEPHQGSTASRRRSSGPHFDSLMNHKRSTDPNAQARRASLHDQRPQAGFFGAMWQKYVSRSSLVPPETIPHIEPELNKV